MIKRGDVYWINLNPVEGDEISKVRPSIIVSNDSANKNSNLITIVPITSRVKKVYLYEVYLPKGTANLNSDSKALAQQIRTVNKTRIKDFIGSVSAETLKQIERTIKIHLSLDEFNID
jgi:mRNA interferase MazF